MNPKSGMLKPGLLTGAAALAVGAAVAMTPMTSNAGTIDFTAASTYSGATDSLIVGTIFGVNYSVTGIPDASLNYSQSYDGAPDETRDLAEERDGLGIGDDEISNPGKGQGPKEVVTVAFDKTVQVTGLHILDAFRISDEKEGIERMQVWLNAPDDADASYFTGGGQDRVIKAKKNPGLGGYKFQDMTKGKNSDLFEDVNSISFTAARGNDGRGVADAALAGIDVAPIPLPAAGLLLLGGLGGLGGLSALRRRRKAA